MGFHDLGVWLPCLPCVTHASADEKCEAEREIEIVRLHGQLDHFQQEAHRTCH